MLSLEEKKELVIANYKLSYDLDIAMLKVDVTEDEKKLMLHDSSFLYRVEYEKAIARELVVSTMFANMMLKGPISQKAAVDFGNLIWPEKFKGKDTGPVVTIPDTIILKGKK